MQDESGPLLARFFEKAGFSDVAIYGGAAAGNHAYQLLDGSGIRVNCLIDRNSSPFFPYDIRIIPPESAGTLPADTAILVTLPTADIFTRIYRTLRLYTQNPIFHLGSLIASPLVCRKYFAARKHVLDGGGRLYLFGVWLPTVMMRNPTPREMSIVPGQFVVDAPEAYHDLLRLMYDDIGHFSIEYLREIFSRPALIRTAAGYVNGETRGRYHNAVNGVRITTDVPDEYDATIHLFGNCTWYGVGAEDGLTVASQLQRMVNEASPDTRRYRVVNRSVWGQGEDPNFSRVLQTRIRPGDICMVLASNQDIRLLQTMEPGDDSVVVGDLAPAFDRPHDQGEVFCDFNHFTHKGARLMARRLYAVLRDGPPAAPSGEGAPGPGANEASVPPAAGRGHAAQAAIRDHLDDYLRYLAAEKIDGAGKAGGIVMNCNPFTLGHRYLIETALNHVGFLYVFCLEEDRSRFSFADRFAMMRKGTRDLDRVRILRGGRLIISDITFPGYFTKENAGELERAPVFDVELFGEYIAPALDIGVRFAGDEPNCRVTAQYNQTMADVLPKHGVEFHIIKRLENAGRVVSASLVREYLRAGRLDLVRLLVPDTTYDHIAKNAASSPADHNREAKDCPDK